MCVLDQLSFSIVNGDGFRSFCIAANLIDDAGDLPSRDAISYTYLKKLADGCIAGVKLVLKEEAPKSVNYLFDIWSNPRGRSFLNIYVSFVTKNFELINLLLAFKYINKHTSKEIKTIVQNTIEFYELAEHESTATTDGGSDVKSACTMMNLSRDHCLAHDLHLMVNDVFKEVPQLLDVINQYKAVCRALTYSSDSLRTVVQMDASNKMADLPLLSTTWVGLVFLNEVV